MPFSKHIVFTGLASLFQSGTDRVSVVDIVVVAITVVVDIAEVVGVVGVDRPISVHP